MDRQSRIHWRDSSQNCFVNCSHPKIVSGLPTSSKTNHEAYRTPISPAKPRKSVTPAQFKDVVPVARFFLTAVISCPWKKEEDLSRAWQRCQMIAAVNGHAQKRQLLKREPNNGLRLAGFMDLCRNGYVCLYHSDLYGQYQSGTYGQGRHKFLIRWKLIIAQPFLGF